MKKIIIILILFISFSSYAANYFIKPAIAGGNDADDGLSDSTAWATITKLNSVTLAISDSVLLKRGSTFDGTALTVKSGVIYAAYGIGEKPIIKLRPSVTNWNNSASWTQSGNNWYIAFTISENNRLWLNNLEIQQSESAAATNSTNKVYFDDGNNRLYLYSTTNPAVTFSNIQTSGYNNVIDAANIDNVSLINLDLRGGRRTINLRGCDNWLIDNCNIGLDASITGLTAYAYAGVDNTSDNGIIRNCVFDSGDRFFDLFQALNTFEGIWLYYGCNNWQVYNNIVKDWAHYGISVEGIVTGYTTSNNKIYNNSISNITDYGTGLGMQGIEGATSGNEVYGNIIYDVPAGVHLMDKGVRFHHNLIYNVRDCPWRTSIGTGIMIDGYSSLVPQNMKIYNNTIANCTNYGLRFGVGGTPRTGNRIINNIFYNCDVANGYQILVNLDASNIGNTWLNNIFYKAGVASVVNFKGVIYTAQQFNARNNTNGDSILTSIQINPLFVSNNNYTLQPHSGAINTGININLTQDIIGNRIDGNPDIGCYEYIGSFGIKTQIWNNITGNAVSYLTKNAAFPLSPSSESVIQSMELASNIGNNFGARIIGYITAPSSGVYYFWISSNEQSELWIGTTSLPASKRRICYVSGSTGVRVWNKYKAQKSIAVLLVSGQKYYIEALMKESTGADNLAIGWSKPGQSTAAPSEIIPGSVLSY